MPLKRWHAQIKVRNLWSSSNYATTRGRSVRLQKIFIEMISTKAELVIMALMASFIFLGPPIQVGQHLLK
ncbi:MAG: hypothetical protein CMM45_03970 [Rhodospirillaceae bacterium]|nr:hypothetical protein [Rhodospirillaceae bacterium]